MSRYPILVERFKGKQAFRVVCTTCDARHELTGDQVAGEDGYRAGEGLLACVRQDCDGRMTYAYMEATRCGGCQRLGFYEQALDYCCSKKCQLQAEYAKKLKA